MQDFSFDWAISPKTQDRFFAEHFERAPMVVNRDAPDYFADLLSFAEIDRVISTMGLSHPEVNATQAGAQIKAADFAFEDGRIDPVRIAQLYADGATLILSSLQDRLPKLARYCRALEAVLSARVQTNIYMTPPGHQGFNPHYDSHDVLVLQVAGSKEWRLFGTPIELPLADQAFERGGEFGVETARFTLHPGDTAYIPRGLAHDAVALGAGPSLHVTTGLMVRSWADAMVEAISMMARRDLAFRRALPPGFANPGADLAQYDDIFGDLVQRLGHAPADKVLGAFREDFLASRVPRSDDQMAQIAALADLSTESLVGAQPDLIYHLEIDAQTDQMHLLVQGVEITLPAHARQSLEYCLRTPAFRVTEMAGDLDDPGKLVLVRRLVREGLMRML
ncbi:cupin domain-containing protein [Gymnodinialimonas sp. 2305UL16-5]|uniref:cupin domain-containing protein n=1 Tax=Gymnodinialimonas mytili TaxID=3126503 RepID=UPI0030AD9E2F